MTAKLKEDLEWDFGTYISKVNMVQSKVAGAIERFSKCLRKLEEEDTSGPEIKEDLATIEIEESLVQSLIGLGENLKNQAFHNSLLISAYSFLEFSFVEYSKLINNYLDVDIPYEETKGIGILKCKRFLNRELNLNVHLLKDWAFLNDIRELRNLIIHNNSNVITNPELSVEKQANYEKLNKYEEIEITESGYIFIKDMSLINKVVESAIEFINEIISKTLNEIEK